MNLASIRHRLHPIRRAYNKKKMELAELLFRWFPLQNKVLFSNFFGRGLADDVKYILLNLLKRENHPTLCWVVENKNVSVPEGVIPVRYGSLRYVYHLCTSKVWVFNIRNLYKTKKKPGQYYIQTWHGGMLGLKRAESVAAESLGEEYVAAAKQDSQMADLFYTNNKTMEQIFRKDFFDYKGEILISDVPRMSVLLNPPDGIKEKVYGCLNISLDKKLVLYAPTFRKKDGLEIFKWNYERVLKACQERFGGEFVFLLRLHPNIAFLSKSIQYTDSLINASVYPDMQELLIAADVLVNDYSSSIFEFAYLKKPVFLYAPDVYEYVHDDRPLLFDFAEIPFKFCKTDEELAKEIQNYDSLTYESRLNDFFACHGLHDSGLGDVCIADQIMQRLS